MNIVIPEQGRVIAHYGAEVQAMIHMEECAELAQAVSKVRRARNEGRPDLEEQDNLCGEIADVLISIQQMMVMYDISDREIQRKVDLKLKRQFDRMEESYVAH